MPKMYRELADWWYLVSAPEDYAEEAAIFAEVLLGEFRGTGRPALLELGSGGGNNASFLKKQFRMTLVDPSAGMLTESKRLNPECEHVIGDMRSVRLERVFDAVFVHDAVGYMASLEDLRRAMETAWVHCREGGIALFVPDYTRETFREETDHGGQDGEGRSLRYLEWVWDPDPADCVFVADYVFALRDADGRVRVEHDRHVEGLFGREEWLALLAEVGFEARALPYIHSEVDRPMEMFAGIRKAGG